MGYDIERLKDKLQIAKFKMLQDKFCFFGILALYFEYFIKEDVDTAYTDGKNIVFGTAFLDKLSLAETQWVIAHEVMHVANSHMSRRMERDPKLFNCAADYAIHSILKDWEDSEFSMPENCLYDAKYNDKSCEEIYQILREELDNQKDGGEKSLNDMCGKMLDDHDQWGSGEDGGSEEKADDAEWESRVQSAAKVASSAKSCGKLPAYLKKILAKLQPPKKDWRVILQEFVSTDVFDYSFNPPDRRFSGSDCILPDFNEEDDSVKNIVFFVDISGSMSEKDICEVYSEIVGATTQFNNMTGYLGYFDTEVHDFKKFEDVNDILKNKPHSGGGTEFQVCFEYLNDTDLVDMQDIAGIVILTDGYCGYGKSEQLSQGVPTLWMYTENSIDPAPFGRSLYLHDEDYDADKV